MRILIIMDPGIAIPLNGYGGHERLVEMFAKEYHRLGHSVDLLITTGSKVKGCVVHDFGKEGFPPKKIDALKAVPRAWKFLWIHRNEFDVIHNFGRLAYLLPVLNHRVKKIMTYGREITSRNIDLINLLGGHNIWFTACSANLLSRVKSGGNWHVVYNAIEFNKYQLQPEVEENAPLIFLGRIEKIKGCHTAIKIAIATGNKLIIAGNISPLSEEQDYFKTEIEPFIDGNYIKYVGAVNDIQKNDWLGKSKALLFPIEWDEPFGIVMIEAMACGTPVIAFNRGSVDEVVHEGTTGFKINNYEEMLEAVKNIGTIDRKKCRVVAAQRFDVVVIAKQYLDAVDTSRKKIAIVTTGQPAANPRVVKEYEKLKIEGYDVKVFYTYSAEWSYKIDEEKFRSGKLRQNDFIEVGGNPFNRKIAYFLSRLLHNILAKIAGVMPLFFLKQITLVRSSFGLWVEAKKFKADIYIAHYLGALPAVIKAGSLHKAALVFDAEDFHRGEDPYYPGQIADVTRIEDRLLPKVNLITTASPLISEYYQNLYPDKKVITINNVFSSRFLQKNVLKNNVGLLKVFWFSQNIGPNRGLELIVDAMNQVSENISLTLLGSVRNTGYLIGLLNRSTRPERITILKPVSPESIFEIASAYDIGIAGEIPHSLNRDICLTNKIFTYLLAGNCILASHTSAQKRFLNTFPQVGFLYRNDDTAELSALFRKLSSDRILLNKCQQQSLSLAASVLNWEHESVTFNEEIKLLLKHDAK